MRAILVVQSPRLSASLLDPDEIRLLRKALGEVEKTKMKTPAERASSQSRRGRNDSLMSTRAALAKATQRHPDMGGGKIGR
jgi:hypothetical protein